MTLLSRFSAFLNRPYHLLVSEKQGWFYIIGLSLIIPLLLNLQQPFGIHCWHHPYKSVLLCGFGCTFLAAYTIMYSVMPLYCSGYFNPSRWTIQKETATSALLFLFIGVLNWLYNRFVINQTEALPFSFFEIEYYTFIFGILPKIILLLVVRYRHMLHSLPVEVVTTVESDDISEVSMLQNTICIKSEQIPVHTILFIQAHENYILLHSCYLGKYCVKSYRQTIRKIESDLSEHGQFIRCHKSYIVNTHHIDNLKTKKLKNLLHIKFCDKTIPISRVYSQRLKEALSA